MTEERIARLEARIVDAAWEKSHACSELKDYGG